MRKIATAGLGLAGALALVLMPAGPASAHPQAQATDVVGVGSDTAQFGVDFLAEGFAGHAGFNTGSLDRRVYNFDASGDASGGTTSGSNGSTSVVLRAGQNPVAALPNGSGSGITAMLADTGTTEQINYVRASRLPKASEQATAADSAHNWGGLHVYQFATDGLGIAVSQKTATNAPAALTPQDLVNIYNGVYTKWSDVPGYSGPAPTATIDAFLPQSGSGTRTFFLADLQAATGTTVTPAASVKAMQEHDPLPIESDGNAIAPFSTGRVGLLNNGYLGAGIQNVVKLLSGTGTYSDPARGLYILVRERDVHDHTVLPSGVTASGLPFPWQADGTRNWVETLFAGPTSWIAKAANNPLIAAADFTPAYSDLGLASSG